MTQIAWKKQLWTEIYLYCILCCYYLNNIWSVHCYQNNICLYWFFYMFGLEINRLSGFIFSTESSLTWWNLKMIKKKIHFVIQILCLVLSHLKINNLFHLFLYYTCILKWKPDKLKTDYYWIEYSSYIVSEDYMLIKD